MDKNDQTLEKNVTSHGPRYERNRKYYLKNTHASLRSTLLHNIKTNVRIPSEPTSKKNSLTIEELIKNWRSYKQKVGCELSPIKKMKFEVLIVNLI